MSLLDRAFLEYMMFVLRSLERLDRLASRSPFYRAAQDAILDRVFGPPDDGGSFEEYVSTTSPRTPPPKASKLNID